MKNDVVTKSALKAKKRKKIIKFSKIALLIIFLILLISYVTTSIIYNNGNFSITLDKNLYYDKNIYIYDNVDYKVYRSELYAKAVDSFDNISSRWLPDDINDSEGGSHNGENYIAYTFYIENFGDMTSDYWSEIIIDDVVRNVDEAVRIRVYKDDTYETYAKTAENGDPENDTIAFESDTLVARDHVADFKPGDIIKYTVVIWLEGTDPECTDNILGGEIKLHMEFNSEFIDEN